MNTHAPSAPGLAVIDAPTNLGLRPPALGLEPGVRALPAALREAGLVRRLGARDAGQTEPQPYSPMPDAATGFLNGPAISRFAMALADRLAPILAGGEFALVFGGDCSVLLGCGLALRRRGRYGLAFVDGHDDFSIPRDHVSRRGRLTAAGLDLYLATGHGRAALADLDGLGASFREEDVVHVGMSRTAGDALAYEVESFDRSGIRAFPADVVHERGADAVAAAARERLEAAPVDGFWIHVDADVLDARVMPAVDSPTLGGLELGQLETILAVLLESPRAVGMELTILDPVRDREGRYVAAFAGVVERAFVRSGRAPDRG